MNVFKSSPAVVLLLAGLAACSGNGYTKTGTPPMSQMVLNDQTIPEARSIQVPMPAAPVQTAKVRAQATSLFSANSSLIGDRRASSIGDVVTVNIDISDQASLSNASQETRNTAKTVGYPNFFGYDGLISKALGRLGSDGLPDTGNVVDLSSSSTGAGSGTIARNEKISLRVAALIIEELPNGNFVLAGRQEVRVNSELRELRVAGIIRRADITSANTIDYDKIAEARISYGGQGQISNVQAPRYGSRALDVILPY